MYERFDCLISGWETKEELYIEKIRRLFLRLCNYPKVSRQRRGNL